MSTATLPLFPSLAKGEHADVCIVGAGIAGLTTAYLLGRAGKSVVVLDDGPIVSGETERTTAHLVTALDDRYFELERLHGQKGAHLAAQSHAAAIDQIERIVAEEKIDCDFERLDGYLFVSPGSELLIVGGEDHKTGQADDAEDRYSRLEQWARARFPMMGEIKFCWSGQVMESIDGLAFIGPNPKDKKNVYIVTGDSGNGMTHGTIAGMLLTDLIQGRENAWASLYDPSRKTLSAAARFAKETLNMAVQYTDWVTAGDVKQDVAIVPGAGGVVRRGLKKIAVYCDEAGILHECSAVCPHLGGIVAWNHSEKTWDCPCHGSRFDKFGKVVNGPANTNLPAVEANGAH